MSEKSASVLSGYLMLALGIALLAAVGGILYYNNSTHNSLYTILSIVLLLVAMFLFSGLFIVNPNDAKVMVLFGSYAGTVRRNGFFWANPFSSRRNIASAPATSADRSSK